MENFIIILFLLIEFAILYSHYKLNFKYAQSFLALLIFLSIKVLDKKMIFINVIFILGLIILLPFCFKKRINNQTNQTNQNNQNNIENFSNSILQDFSNNKKVEKYESNLNHFISPSSKKKKKQKKEKFSNTNSEDYLAYYKSFNKSPIYKKKYRSSLKSFNKKMPFFIEKFKEIFQ
tara:strand:+ start:742 stop:1272 length:531 start_codon:yes stop_codon:yes gene_type:complete